MVKRERSLGSAVRAMRVAVNSLGACEATGFRTWTGEVSVVKHFVIVRNPPVAEIGTSEHPESEESRML